MGARPLAASSAVVARGMARPMIGTDNSKISLEVCDVGCILGVVAMDAPESRLDAIGASAWPAAES